MRLISLLILVVAATSAFGQQKAVTENGEEVVLYSNGTWIYADRTALATEDIRMNETVFSKPKKASFLLKSKKINVGCYLDPKAWKFNAADPGSAAEFQLNHTGGDLYGMIITEKLDLPLESLAQIAVENARDAAPDIKVTHKEYRMVNGLKVMMMRMTGTIQEIHFSYCGYYYTGDGGATQFLVYSSESVMTDMFSEVEELLNGFVKTTD